MKSEVWRPSQKLFFHFHARDLPIVGHKTQTVIVGALFERVTLATGTAGATNRFILRGVTHRHRGERSFVFGGDIGVDYVAGQAQIFQFSVYAYQYQPGGTHTLLTSTLLPQALTHHH